TSSLEVRQEPIAVYSKQTGQYHVQLTCTSHHGTTASVIWTNPLGQKLNSSSSDGGEFRLLLPNPVTSGLYDCCALAPNAKTTCPESSSASVLVDNVDARFMVMDAEHLHKLREMDITHLAALKRMEASSKTKETELSEKQKKMEASSKTKETELLEKLKDMEVNFKKMETELSTIRREKNNMKQKLLNFTSVYKCETTGESSDLKQQMEKLQSKCIQINSIRDFNKLNAPKHSKLNDHDYTRRGQVNHDPRSPEYTRRGQVNHDPRSPEYTRRGQVNHDPRSPEYTRPRQVNHDPRSPEYTRPGQVNHDPRSPEYTRPGQVNHDLRSPEYTRPGQDNHDPRSPVYTRPGQVNHDPRSPVYTRPGQVNHDPRSPLYATPGQVYHEYTRSGQESHDPHNPDYTTPRQTMTTPDLDK
ncbi:hypothetical protein BaRGS_00021146, partial [Batillaria attramentaria]